MVRLWIVALACAFGFVLPAVAAPPLEAYGQLQTLDKVVVSPDGASLALLANSGANHRIAVMTSTDHKPLAIVNIGAAKVRNLQWADSGHLLIIQSVTQVLPDSYSTQSEYFLLSELDLKTQKVRGLLNDRDKDLRSETGGEDELNILSSGSIQVRTIRGKTVAYVHGLCPHGERYTVCLIAVDIDSGSSDQVEVGSEYAVDWLLDAAGNQVAEELYDEVHGDWSLKLKIAGRWTDSKTIHAKIDPPNLIGQTWDGGAVIVQQMDKGHNVYSIVSLKDGTWGEETRTPFDSWIVDPKTGYVIGGAGYSGDELKFQFFDPTLQATWDAIGKAYPGELVSLSSWSDDGDSIASWSLDRKKLVIRLDGPLDGNSYALVDLTTGNSDTLGDAYADIKLSDILENRAVSYKAADGTTITGYLTLPAGKPAKGLPLIVMPHGGPAARDFPDFDWWSQALASKGYAVLRPNYRGSDGFGHDFLAAGYGQWGRKMQTDLSDGVRFLAGQGIVDPKRVCIVGASYGGYAALAGPTLDPGIYRCAVAVAGISDMSKFMDWRAREEGHHQNATMRYWEQYMGGKDGADPSVKAISPVAHVADVTVPILLIHGKADTVVPYEQSQIMYDALTRAGKPVSLVTMKAEDHWLSHSDTRLEMLQSTVTFLEANNPPN